MIELTDKHRQLKQFKDDLFNKTLTMFEWQNLPDTLPQVELEKLLQINGFAVIAEYKGNLYAFNAGFSGQDAYQRPTQAIINNPALHLNQTFTINQDCVVIKNDDMKQGLTKLFEKYGQLAIENMITMLMTDYNLRMPFTISSQDDSTTQSAKEFLQKIIDGSLGVIGESKLFQSLNVTPTKNNSGSNFADLYGYQQYILAELNNAIGLATNNNMKRERLTTNEIEVNKNASYPLVDNMLRNRQQAVEKINELFDTDINVDFSSIWGGINDVDNDSSIDGSDDENVDDGSITDNSDNDDTSNDGGEVTDGDNGNADVTSDGKSVDGGNDEPTNEDEPEEKVNDETDNDKQDDTNSDENSTSTDSNNDGSNNDDERKKKGE